MMDYLIQKMDAKIFALDKSTLSDQEQRMFFLNEILRGEQNERDM